MTPDTGREAQNAVPFDTPVHAPPDTSSRNAGIALALTSGVLFAVFPVIGRVATQYDISKVTQLSARFLLGALLIAPFVLRAGVPRLTLRQLAGLSMMGGMYVLQSIFYLMSTDRIPIGMTSILLYLYPAVVTLLSRVFLHEPLTPRKLLALAMACIGALLTIGAPGAVTDMTGVWMALVTPTVYSIYIIVGAKLQRGVSAQLSSMTIMASAGVLSLLIGLLTGALPAAQAPAALQLRFDFPAPAWAALIGLAAICTAPPVLAFLASVRRIGASQTSILSTIELVATALFGALFFGELLQPVQLAGGALVIAAVVALSLRAD